MSLGSEDYTPQALYEMVLDQDKLKSYPGFQRALDMGIAKDMSFNHDLPYEEIREYVGGARGEILGKVAKELLEEHEVKWEHIGSTAIKGMPGTIYPDALILFKAAPAPKPLFMALLEAGFTFIGAGPFDPADLWFLRKVAKEGSRLDGAIFKVHLTPATLGTSRVLLETRDRCNNNPEDFEDYKSAKVEAAEHLKNGNIMGYKGAKGKSKLIAELTAKYTGK